MACSRVQILPRAFVDRPQRGWCSDPSEAAVFGSIRALEEDQAMTALLDPNLTMGGSP